MKVIVFVGTLLLLFCCLIECSILGSIFRIVFPFRRKKSDSFNTSFSKSERIHLEETIAELIALNAALKDQLANVKKMVYYHKKEALDAKKALQSLQKEFNDMKNQKSKVTSDDIEALKKELANDFETEKSKLLKQALREFNEEKERLIESMNTSHDDNIQKIRKELMEKVEQTKNEANVEIKELKAKLQNEKFKLEAKSKEIEEYRKQEMKAVKVCHSIGLSYLL
jgi:hypothetical protein